MADNEDDNNSASNTVEVRTEHLGSTETSPQTEATLTVEEENNAEENSSKPSCDAEGGVDAGLAELLHSQSAVDLRVEEGAQEVIGQIITDSSLVTSFVQATGEAAMTAECATVSGDVLNALAPNTTIIYVQPDGSFVESSGLSAEEQQQLIEQLAKQQLVHVASTERPAKPSATAPSVELQKAIVSKAQSDSVTSQRMQPKVVTAQPASYITLEPGNLQLAPSVGVVQNASLQLKSVAKQVALQQSQNGALVTTTASSSTSKAPETIQIQVKTPLKPDIKQRQATPITILQPQNLSTTQPLVKVSTVGTLSSPQIFHISPVPGQQQFFLQNPSDPPIQLLLQKPTSVVGTISVPINKVHIPSAATVKSPPARPAVSSPKILVTSPQVLSPTVKITSPKVIVVDTKATTLASKENAQKLKNREKKVQKIKTRSGRVSRPPKHKVKDYKFIKNEDLAESHQSDSDDYSEISVEDEEGEERKRKSTNMTLNLRDKAFKCETCEKAYIGVAGLNRHYRLNPIHGKCMSPLQAEDLSKTRDEQPSGTTEETRSTLEKPVMTQKVPEIAKVEPRRPGRPRGPGWPGLARRPGRPPKRGRPGRPPKYPRGVSLEEQSQRQKNRLKEFIKQYDDDDLMEIVLPRLARVMTVWEFVMMKVEKGYPSKQQFPNVYHEFEELHSQVKKMALEYLHMSPASRPAIEVNNMGVLQSLGVTDPNALNLLTSSEAQQSQKTNQLEPRTLPASKSLQTIENARMLPPAKRFKMENCNEETNGYQVNQNGFQKDANVEDSVLRKPQVVLTRLENLSAVNIADGGAADSHSEEEPMETEVPDASSDATKTMDDPEISKVLDSSVAIDIADQVKELEQALSTETESPNTEEVSQKEDEQASADSSVGNVIQQESAVMIQTAEGLVMQSAEELAAKGIVIVNGPDGTMMHIEAPEGVPLETVHALLGIETEKKT